MPGNHSHAAQSRSKTAPRSNSEPGASSVAGNPYRRTNGTSASARDSARVPPRPEGQRRGAAEQGRNAQQQRQPDRIVAAAVGQRRVLDPGEPAADLVDQLAPVTGGEQPRLQPDHDQRSRCCRKQQRRHHDSLDRRPKRSLGDELHERGCRADDREGGEEAAERRLGDQPRPLQQAEGAEGAEERELER